MVEMNISEKMPIWAAKKVSWPQQWKATVMEQSGHKSE